MDMIDLAHIPLYLYPFLNSTYKPKPFEYLRLTSLGVIGALVKVGYTLLQVVIVIIIMMLLTNIIYLLC
jgi:hypothetical protein